MNDFHMPRRGSTTSDKAAKRFRAAVEKKRLQQWLDQTMSLNGVLRPKTPGRRVDRQERESS
jgi:hypothetical protein